MPVPIEAVLETERLRLRKLNRDDAAFMLELLNQPGWKRFIGDRGADLQAAREYLLTGPIAMYAREGFGLWHIGLKADASSPPAGELSLGICGLIRRDGLADVDIGFALLARHEGKGYASEAAAASLTYGREQLGLKRIVAICDPENQASIRLLEKLGLRPEGRVRLSPGAREDLIFGIDFDHLDGALSGPSAAMASQWS